MPIQSRYSNEAFEKLMQDVFAVLEKHQADRDLSIMALGNVISTLFTSNVAEQDRQQMVEQFCKVLKKSTLTQH